MTQMKFNGLDGTDEVTISAIHITVGQTVKKGDKAFDVEADKASDTLMSDIDGIVSEINIKAGDTIKTGEVLFTVGGTVKTSVAPSTSEKAEASQSAPVEEKSESSNNGTIVLATPLVRKMARDLKVDMTKINGTGPNGRVLVRDLEAGESSNSTSSSAQAPSTETTTVSTRPIGASGQGKINVAKIESFGKVEHLPLTPIRKAIAANMVTSKQTAPHVTLMIDVDATNLINMRNGLKDEMLKPENGAVKVTFMPFFIKAVAKALSEERFKLLNSTFNLDGNEILVKKYYNIGMAADTDKGLVVPVIKNADKLSLIDTAKEVNLLADKARKGALKGDDMAGGTFTITNFGSAGLKYGTPVINYPEVAILGLGALELKPVYENNQIALHSFFPLSISIDHRVVDGAPAGFFMQRIKFLLENPALIAI